MKVIHIESGLGNQMLSYCEYLAMKMMNPEDDTYIETIVYDIAECDSVISQWNGFELKRIFNVNAHNIKECFTDEQWKEIIKDIRSSKFWEKNWNYPVYFVNAFSKAGLQLKNIRGDFEEPSFRKKYSNKKTIKKIFLNTRLGYLFKQKLYELKKEQRILQVNNQANVFIRSEENLFTGQWLSFKNKANGIERIEKLIRETFVFPNFEDAKNKEMAKYLSSCNSVAIHARRGDLLSYNANCYKYGYFKKAVNYIKAHVTNPVFVFFCDPGSIEWCRENSHTFGLNILQDDVKFVDWNKGENSYRDMQLMTYCKHAIITNSSFGWWGAYLINYPNKITISPDYTINTTHWFY